MEQDCLITNGGFRFIDGLDVLITLCLQPSDIDESGIVTPIDISTGNANFTRRSTPSALPLQSVGLFKGLH